MLKRMEKTKKMVQMNQDKESFPITSSKKITMKAPPLTRDQFKKLKAVLPAQMELEKEDPLKSKHMI